jgi:two-component system nitrate/nitrite response regulator NarL
MIVDDNPAHRDLIVGFLCSREGSFEVAGTAANGIEATVRAESTHPDVILMDIAMPVRNGIWATKVLRSSMPDVQVIACSGSGDDDVAQEMLDAGAVCYVSKPVDLEELARVLRRHGGGSRA